MTVLVLLLACFAVGLAQTVEEAIRNVGSKNVWEADQATVDKYFDEHAVDGSKFLSQRELTDEVINHKGKFEGKDRVAPDVYKAVADVFCGDVVMRHEYNLIDTRGPREGWHQSFSERLTNEVLKRRTDCKLDWSDLVSSCYCYHTIRAVSVLEYKAGQPEKKQTIVQKMTLATSTNRDEEATKFALGLAQRGLIVTEALKELLASDLDDVTDLDDALEVFQVAKSFKLQLGFLRSYNISQRQQVHSYLVSYNNAIYEADFLSESDIRRVYKASFTNTYKAPLDAIRDAVRSLYPELFGDCHGKVGQFSYLPEAMYFGVIKAHMDIPAVKDEENGDTPANQDTDTAQAKRRLKSHRGNKRSRSRGHNRSRSRDRK